MIRLKKKITGTPNENWTHLISQVELGYKKTIHSITGFTPKELIDDLEINHPKWTTAAERSQH